MTVRYPGADAVPLATNEFGNQKVNNALKGVCVLNFTHVPSGPACTQLLARFGADVIKDDRGGIQNSVQPPMKPSKPLPTGALKPVGLK